jgi:hypothetical protein
MAKWRFHRSPRSVNSSYVRRNKVTVARLMNVDEFDYEHIVALHHEASTDLRSVWQEIPTMRPN